MREWKLKANQTVAGRSMSARKHVGASQELYWDGWKANASESSGYTQAPTNSNNCDIAHEAAARYLKRFGLILRNPLEAPDDAIKRLLDAVPQARITKDCLNAAAAQVEDDGETEWVLPAGVNLVGRHIYQMRSILNHRRINGRGVFLTSWEPTRDPITNLPSAEVKKYRKRRRIKVERQFIEAEAHEE
ncbi:hypothetical protein PHMEG_00023697 [Phytophthora megakarya]|uniref:Uncharacterized protein n=1 Tax=Phytophthora megakarya TaxID=4795 RepID=A0A225VI00_9STRA|nr:hypothetical protein PHMEG_00023697 [Phytophthora megakarya]